MVLVLIIIGTEMYLARFPPSVVTRLEINKSYIDLLKVDQWKQFATSYDSITEGQVVDLPQGCRYITIWEL